MSNAYTLGPRTCVLSFSEAHARRYSGIGSETTVRFVVYRRLAKNFIANALHERLST